jgi:hypothetical protein
MWRVMAYGRWIVANGLFLSFSCQIKYMIVLFVFGFSISVLILLISYFVFIPFIKVFFSIWSFNYNFLYVLFFHFCAYSFNFYFFLGHFVKVFLAFSFIFQSKFLLFYFFQFNPHSFDLFFFFVETIFQFNLTFQLRIYVCPLIIFYFHPHFHLFFCVIDFFFLVLFFDI